MFGGSSLIAMGDGGAQNRLRSPRRLTDGYNDRADAFSAFGIFFDSGAESLIGDKIIAIRPSSAFRRILPRREIANQPCCAPLKAAFTFRASCSSVKGLGRKLTSRSSMPL